MGRTLYINQNNKPVLSRDGPSILVREEGKAGRRIPVRLVGRVIIIGNVKLDSGSITLFADNNTPVTFMNNAAEETAVVIPYNHKLPDHYKEQKIFFETPENIARYKKWADAKRALLQRSFIRKFIAQDSILLAISVMNETDYQHELIKLRKVGERKWQFANCIVNNLFRSLIIEKLITNGLDPHLGVVHRRHNFGLALDICYIMGGLSDIQTLQFINSCGNKNLLVKEKDNWAVTGEGMKEIVHRFENRRPHLQESMDNIIDELFILMREMAL
ncbi:MAG: CRISPR-associated endonuclease Cas1 [Nitrospirae bacterium]|nr:CRISPR-associated endonuclease Cas1 [Nitrospirota bacterium]